MKGSIHTNQIHTKQVVCHIANASKPVIENHPVGHAEKLENLIKWIFNGSPYDNVKWESFALQAIFAKN